ncbi:hypothetical protein RIF29_37804 [Crotalaria pallida]|uniref:Uncharacterized protein n=1 Tax=Crotalaria pallida TaxID=3830 RepID=A0AAN9DYT6_CROPI
MSEPMVFSASKDATVKAPKPPDKFDDDVRQCKVSFARMVMGSRKPLPAHEKVDLIASNLANHGESMVNQPPTGKDTVDPVTKEGDANGLSFNHQIPIFLATKKSTHDDWMIVEKRKNIRKGISQGANFQGGKKGNVSNPFSVLPRADKDDLNASRAVFSYGVNPTKKPVTRRKWVRKRTRSNGVKIHDQTHDQVQKDVQSKITAQSSSIYSKVSSKNVDATHTDKGGTISTISTSQPTLHEPENSEMAPMKEKESQAPKPSFKSMMNIEWVSRSKFRFLDDGDEVGLKSPRLISSKPSSEVNGTRSVHYSAFLVVSSSNKGDIKQDPP